MRDQTYDEWVAHRELDRMPDPHRNPCEAVEAENEWLRQGIRAWLDADRSGDLPGQSQHYFERLLATSKHDGLERPKQH